MVELLVAKDILAQRINQPSILESIENIAKVYKSDNPDVALMAESFVEQFLQNEEELEANEIQNMNMAITSNDSIYQSNGRPDLN